MIHIDKNLEPRNLTHFRESTPAASYSGLPTNIKDEVKQEYCGILLWYLYMKAK
jgi:hypothetical protein